MAYKIVIDNKINPKHVDYEGRAHMGLDLRLLPVSGNDELRIVTS